MNELVLIIACVIFFITVAVWVALICCKYRENAKQRKKATPQKPMVLIEANGLQWYYCPNCHKLLAYSNSKNPKPNKTPESCPQCEQKINWGQEQ